MKEFPDVFSIVDTETTGTRPPFSRIIDIGIIRVEKGKVVERFESLVNPGVALPSSIHRLTRIDDQALQHAPAFEDIALTVNELLKDAVFVAHNAAFDYAFVKSEFNRIDMSFSAETLCSVKFSRALLPQARSHSLDSIIDRYTIPFIGQRHRALPDAEAVWEFFKRVHDDHTPKDIRRAISRARSGNFSDLKPASMSRDTFTDMPDSAGVYFFYGPEQELLYIGKSKHVRTRARSHFHTSTNKKEIRIQNETSTVSSVRTSGELSALLLEATLIKHESPLYNRALRRRKLLVTATPCTNEQGFATLLLSRTEHIEPSQEILGVFRTIAQAKIALRVVAKEHRLCHKLLGLESGGGACFGYQLKTCDGACLGTETKDTVEAYNARFEHAFAQRRLKTWPYKGIVMIDEKEDAERGTVIFIENWMLRGAFTYDGEEYTPFIQSSQEKPGFEYDIYKILVRYMHNVRNKRSIRVLSPLEFKRTYARITSSYEEEIIYDTEIL